jgi:riboflavin synthase
VFTGIVTAVGRIARLDLEAGGARAVVEAPGLGLEDVAIGDSIAVNGVCLTVVARDASRFEVDLSPETLASTAGFEASSAVNLEKALRLADRLGGHLVSGHVDGVGEVTRVEAVGDNRVVSVRAPDELERYIARKGSVTVDGVSLTVNAVRGTDFEVNLIPHTRASTSLGSLRPGRRVNLEVDLLARYLERLLGRD